MRNIKTYEGFFDFFKKKNYEPISIGHLLDCLLPLTDNDKIKSDLSDNTTDGIFTSIETVTKEEYSLGRSDMGKFYAGKNTFFFHMQYSPVGVRRNYPMNYYYNGVEFGAISDDEVNSIMKECQETLEGFDCEMTFFIGLGSNTGRSYDIEFSDINKMVDRTVKRPANDSIGPVRNIIVKIKALGGIEE